MRLTDPLISSIDAVYNFRHDRPLADEYVGRSLQLTEVEHSPT